MTQRTSKHGNLKCVPSPCHRPEPGKGVVGPSAGMTEAHAPVSLDFVLLLTEKKAIVHGLGM